MFVQHTSLRQEKVSDAAREQNKLRFKHISFYWRSSWIEEITIYVKETIKILFLGFLPRDTAKHHRENIIDILRR